MGMYRPVREDERYRLRSLAAHLAVKELETRHVVDEVRFPDVQSRHFRAAIDGDMIALSLKLPVVADALGKDIWIVKNEAGVVIQIETYRSCVGA